MKRTLITIDPSLHPRVGERGSISERTGFGQALHVMADVLHAPTCRCKNRRDLERMGRYFHQEGRLHADFLAAYAKATMIVLELRKAALLPWAIECELQLRKNKQTFWTRTFAIDSVSGEVILS